jgi:hypothetical protein
VPSWTTSTLNLARPLTRALLACRWFSIAVSLNVSFGQALKTHDFPDYETNPQRQIEEKFSKHFLSNESLIDQENNVMFHTS